MPINDSANIAIQFVQLNIKMLQGSAGATDSWGGCSFYSSYVLQFISECNGE